MAISHGFNNQGQLVLTIDGQSVVVSLQDAAVLPAVVQHAFSQVTGVLAAQVAREQAPAPAAPPEPFTVQKPEEDHGYVQNKKPRSRRGQEA